jgi:hypothetical protein
MHHAFSDIDQGLVAQRETATHHIRGSALQPASQGLLMGRCSELGAREIHNTKTLVYRRSLRSCVAMLEASEDVITRKPTCQGQEGATWAPHISRHHQLHKHLCGFLFSQTSLPIQCKSYVSWCTTRSREGSTWAAETAKSTAPSEKCFPRSFSANPFAV